MEKFDEIIRKRKKFNGKPFSYWKDQADELVIESILRAALLHTETQYPSIINYLVGKRLLEIAQAENSAIVKKILTIRSNCIEGFKHTLRNLL